MSKHTPGPWYIVAFSSGDVSVRDAGGLISSGHRPSHFQGQDERYETELAEYHANARLIAAAPDLLEALERLVEPYDASVSYSCAVDAAIKAIAKAKGDA